MYPKLQKINSQKATDAILKRRNQGTINTLTFLAKERCGIGKSRLNIIQNFFKIE